MRYDGSMKRNSQNPTCCPESKTAYLIKYHYDRLLLAAEHMGWFHTAKVMKGPTDLFDRVTKAVDMHKRKTGNKCPFKVCRVYFVLLEFHSPSNQFQTSPHAFPFQDTHKKYQDNFFKNRANP